MRSDIIYVSSTHYPSHMAHAVQQLKTAHAMARSGAKLSFYIKNSGGSAPGSEEILALYDLQPNCNLQIKQIKVIGGVHANRHYIATLLPQLAVKFGRRDSKILYTREGVVAVLLGPFVRAGGGIVAFEAHDLANRELRYRGFHRRTELFQQLALRQAQKVITVTHRAARDMIALGIPAERVLVAADAAEPLQQDSFSTALDIQRPIIITYTGSLQWDRGVLTLIGALPYLPEEWRQRVRVRIVGGLPADVAQLAKTVQELQLKGIVDLIGQVSHSKVKSYLKESDLFVLPTRKSFFGENYTSPMKLFEYMSARKPIVCADLSSLREVVSDKHVHFFNTEDSADLARVLINTITNWSDALQRACAAYHLFLGNYTYEARASKILQFLE